MDISYIINPSITSGIVAVVLSVSLLIALWKGSGQIKTAAVWVKVHVFNWTCFFWLVNLVCMAFSAQNAGYIFGLYESTGIFLGVALDLLIIAFTQAMLAAKARGERSRAAKILLFIVFCCLLSTAGNLAHNLHTNIVEQTQGVWFQVAIPYLVSTMPLFLIALAWVADLKVNPIESMDIEQYKANEKKHLEFLQIQLENRERQAELDQRMIVVESLERRNKHLRKGKAPRSFRWPWEPKDLDHIVANVAENMKVFYEEKISEVTKNSQQKIQEIQRLSEKKQAEFEQHIQEFLTQIQQGLLQENEDYRRALAEQYDQDISLLQGRISETLSPRLSSEKASRNTDEMDAIDQGYSQEKREKSEEIIVVDEETQLVMTRYPIVASWLSTGVRSVSVQEIITGTKQSHQRVNKAAREGVFQGTRREGYYRIHSVINWLKTVPLPKTKEADNKSITPELSLRNHGHNQVDNKSITGELSQRNRGHNQAHNQSDNGHSNGHKKATQPLDTFVLLEV